VTAFDQVGDNGEERAPFGVLATQTALELEHRGPLLEVLDELARQPPERGSTGPVVNFALDYEPVLYV
jgi:hypothetical protein